MEIKLLSLEIACVFLRVEIVVCGNYFGFLSVELLDCCLEILACGVWKLLLDFCCGNFFCTFAFYIVVCGN